MITNERKGFTLIEILIVVAIIAILASVVLVGLGPTQQAGRDARRISDLQEDQNGLELFYNKCGFYPGTAGTTCTGGSPGGTTWASVQTALSGANIGVSTVPQDPSTNRTYMYGYDSGNTSYILGAALENANNSAVGPGYTAPTVPSGESWSQGPASISPSPTCTGAPVGGSGATYCVTL